MIDSIYWALQRLIGRGRGVVQDDRQAAQLVQVQYSTVETKDQVPRLSEYGFDSSPPDGFTCVTVAPGGDRTASVVIATSHGTYRMKLQKGEVALSDMQGQQVYLRQGGIMIKDKAGSTVVLNGNGTGTMNFSGGLTINANTTINGTALVTKAITGQGGMAVSGGSGASVAGSMTITGGDVKADNISLKGHTHADPQGGTVGAAQ